MLLLSALPRSRHRDQYLGFSETRRAEFSEGVAGFGCGWSRALGWR